MQHKEMKSRVGKSATKIWDTYQELLEEVKGKNSGAVQSTIATATKTHVSKAVTTATNLDIIGITTVIENLLNDISDAKEKFEELQTAIKAKEVELKEVHGIEVEANALVALVATKDKLVADREEKAKLIIQDAEEKTHSLYKIAETTIQEQHKNANKLQENSKVERRREEEEYNYNFKRQKQVKVDEVHDLIVAAGKKLNVREEDLETREANADELNKQVIDLQTELNKIKAGQVELINAEVGKAKGMATRTAQNEAALIQKDFEAKDTVNKAKIDTLEEQLDELRNRLDTAENRVQLANEKVAEMAQTSLRAGADAATVTRVAEVAASSNKK